MAQKGRHKSMSYRWKQDSDIDAYGNTENVIHFKFGDMRKSYNFTDVFDAKHPRFCEEYRKYFAGEKSLFSDPLAIVNYIEQFDLPVKLYSNMYDEEFEDIDAAKEWIMREYGGQNRDKLFHYESGRGYVGLDNESERVKV